MGFAEEVKEYLGDDAWTVYHAAEMDSTNEWAKRMSGEDTPDLTVFFADEQTAGKGRLGRVWKSPAGTSVSMSVLLRPSVRAEHLSMLTLVMGMAAADGLREVSGLEVGIKWPNDVVIHGKKLCGILTETASDGSWVVIGIGINVNMTEFPEDLKDKASSLRLETGREESLSRTAAVVLGKFRHYYQIFCRTEDMSGLKKDYERMLVNINRGVRVLDPAGAFDGTALGIDEAGDLLVRKKDGTLTHVYSGEVSVRGIYGYT